jgi:hypothetical protein
MNPWNRNDPIYLKKKRCVVHSMPGKYGFSARRAKRLTARLLDRRERLKEVVHVACCLRGGVGREQCDGQRF